MSPLVLCNCVHIVAPPLQQTPIALVRRDARPRHRALAATRCPEPRLCMLQPASERWSTRSRLKSRVIEHDQSSRLPRPVERLKSRARHAHPRDATVEVEADPGFLMTYWSTNGA